jgi:hypothetical protein
VTVVAPALLSAPVGSFIVPENYRLTLDDDNDNGTPGTGTRTVYTRGIFGTPDSEIGGNNNVYHRAFYDTVLHPELFKLSLCNGRANNTQNELWIPRDETCDEFMDAFCKKTTF